LAVLQASAVFTPGTFPTHTYVSRSAQDEEQLDNALRVGGSVISIVGPSKTGKTVLVNRVVEADRLVSVSGSLVDSAESLWRLAGEEGGTPGLGPAEAIKILADEARVLLIDDFHYVEGQAQQRIAQQLKDAVARGLRVIVVAVPHRRDDAIRSNPDLRGRVRKIDLDYWDVPELSKIAHAGFPLLNVDVSELDVRRIARESVRSPQLMQALCLESCQYFDIEGPSAVRRMMRLDDDALAAIASATGTLTDCKTPFEILSAGPRERGRKRTQYNLADGAKGDVYTVILRALAIDPPRLDFSPAELRDRVAQVVRGEPPPGASLRQASMQMDSLIRERSKGDRVFAWDEERQYIDIPDPHFLFFLRWGITG
jgi:hypothetical protein